MSDRNDGWFDLQRAKEVSRRLGTKIGGASSPRVNAPAPPEESRPYTRFRGGSPRSAQPGLAPGPSATPTAAEGTSSSAPVTVPALPEAGVDSWSGLLGWACEAAKAESAFVVDAQGFVLAHHGVWSYEDIEDVGSQLTLIMTRADETEAAGRSRSISLEFGEHWLDGTRMQFSDVGELTFVLLTRDGLERSLVNALAHQVEQAMQRI